MKKENRLFIYAIPAVIVLAVLTVYQYGFVNARKEMVSLRETRAARERALMKCMETIAGRSRIEEKLDALKEKRRVAASKTIEAQTPTLCAAALQEAVKGIITGRGGSIASERVEKAEESGRFQVVTITVDAALPDTRALSDVLFSIETHTPWELMVKLRLSSLAGGK